MKVFQPFAAAILIFASVISHAATLKVFTDRPKDRLEKAFTGFTTKTGIQLDVVVAPYADLLAKIRAGEQPDVLLLKDISFITAAARENLFTPMNAANLRTNISPAMRDSQGNWTALSYRIRTAAYDPAAINVASLTTYEALAGRGFAGQLCMRNSKEYMPTLAAWLIVRYGEAKAQAILEGWKSNLAAGFSEGDSASLKSIESGECTATIANQYYLGRLISADNRFPVKLAFLEQNEGGLHTNGLGGGIAKGSTQAANANIFLGYLMTAEGQAALIEAPAFDYPAVKSFSPESVVKDFGAFKASEITWTQVGAEIEKATAILERVGWAK